MITEMKITEYAEQIDENHIKCKICNQDLNLLDLEQSKCGTNTVLKCPDCFTILLIKSKEEINEYYLY